MNELLLVPFECCMTCQGLISPLLLRQQNATEEERKKQAEIISANGTLLYYIPSVLSIIAKCYHDIVTDNGDKRIHLFVIAMSGITLLIVLLRRNKVRKLKVAALYPLGIQLGTIPVVVTAENTYGLVTATEDKTMTPDIFLHRDSIIDCIVVESVLSYKVQSVVMLRLCESPTTDVKVQKHQTDNNGDDDCTLDRTRTDRDTAIKLIQLFADVDMTYMECLTIRSKINNYLEYRETK
jgi:hypothetical protein